MKIQRLTGFRWHHGTSRRQEKRKSLRTARVESESESESGVAEEWKIADSPESAARAHHVRSCDGMPRDPVAAEMGRSLRRPRSLPGFAPAGRRGRPANARQDHSRATGFGMSQDPVDVYVHVCKYMYAVDPLGRNHSGRRNRATVNHPTPTPYTKTLFPDQDRPIVPPGWLTQHRDPGATR